MCARVRLLVGGEVEVGEDHLPAPHVLPLRLDRLLHLHDHVGFAPDRRGIGRDLGADVGVSRVGEAAALSRALLDHHRVAGRDQRFGAGRHEGDAVLVGLDLFRNANAHVRAV